MILMIFFIIGFFFSLIAISRNKEGEYVKNVTQSITVFAALMAIARINQSTAHLTAVTILILISALAFLIYQFSQTDIEWK